MAALRLTLLGGFEVRLGSGGAVSLPTQKAQALLAYLSLRPAQSHQRSKLAALLWGERSDEQALDGLRHALVALRKALPSATPPPLLVERQTLALNSAVVDVDVVTFERCVAEGTLKALEHAAELYRGDLLDGLTLQEPPFEAWLMAERERLHELALEALAGLLAAQRAEGAAEAALQTGLRLIALDPLQEPVHRTLMRLYAQLGRRGSALHQYQLCVGILQRELGVEPEAETKQLYQEILRWRRSTAAPSAPRTFEGSTASATPRRRPLTVATDIPLIGRDQEMARLRAMLAEAVRGQGRVVAVVGESGVGKSRLVAELAAEIHEVSGSVLIGRCHESEQILPFGPWVEILRTAREVANGTWLTVLPLAMRRELGRLLPELVPEDGESAGLPDYLRPFEGVGLLLWHLVDRQPTVLILEDLHWADEMSVRLLAFIGRRLQARRLLLMVTVRAEDLIDAPMLQRTLDELEREPHVTRVALGPLSRSDTLHLVQALSRPGSEEAEAARLSEQVWRTSGGNPFVVIETMRVAAHEALSPGLEALSLPERLRDIIGRQLDRLDARNRELVALASVVGREFEFALLQHVSGLGEEEAAQRVEGLIRRRMLHSVGERLDFTHDRMREVAYSRILAPRRRSLHRRVAEALATLNAESLESHHLALGLHYVEGEVWGEAVFHLRRAGVRAFERSANREALVCFERALAALAHLPESQATLEQACETRLELRPVLIQLGDVRRARERLREAETLAERLNDDRGRGRVCAFVTNVHNNLGELDEALVTGTRALEIAGRLDDLSLRVLSRSYLGQTHYFRGDHERVIDLATANLAALPADWVHEYFGNAAPASVYDRCWLIMSLSELGRFAEAAQHEAEAIRLAEPTQHVFTVGMAHFPAGTLHPLKGDWAKARSLIEHGLAVVRTGNAVLLLPFAVAASAWVRAQLGQAPEALNQLHEGAQLLERHAARGIVGHIPWAYHSLGRACLLLGRLDEARSMGDRARESSPPRAGFAAHALHLLGDVATHHDRFDAESGEAHYREALAIAEARGMRPLVAHCHLGLGKLYRQSGQLEQAQEHLTTATTMCREMDMRFYLEQAEAAMSGSAGG